MCVCDLTIIVIRKIGFGSQKNSSLTKQALFEDSCGCKGEGGGGGCHAGGPGKVIDRVSSEDKSRRLGSKAGGKEQDDESRDGVRWRWMREEREQDRSSRASVIKTRRLCRKTRRQPPLASSTSFNGPFNPSRTLPRFHSKLHSSAWSDMKWP